MARKHSHGHAHAHGGQTGKVLFASLVITAGFVAIETAAGFRAHSLALLSDAGHNFTDAFGLLLASVGYYFQSRPGDHVKTYGYHRAGVLAAFINALFLVALSLILFYESYQRLVAPQTVEPGTMIWVALLGLAMNIGIAWGLGGHGSDLNVRAAWIHMIGDAAGCAAIVVGAVIIRFTGWLAADSLLSILIAAAIVWTAWDIFKESLNILLEGSPKGVKLAEVTREICCVPGVIDVHDLHIWSLGSEAHALSCHVLIEDMPPSASSEILHQVNHVLSGRFAIHHSTIQFEHTRCALAHENCTVASLAQARDTHTH